MLGAASISIKVACHTRSGGDVVHRDPGLTDGGGKSQRRASHQW